MPNATAPRGGRPLELSVVLATERHATIARTLRHLRSQSGAERLEVVVVTPAPRDPGLDGAASEGFGALTVVEAPDIDSLPRARAKGVRAASAPVVVFGETHCYPHPGWADALVEAHRGRWGAVGPAITCANPSSSLAWVNLFMAYGEWVDPCRPGPREMLPGHNTSFKRGALLELEPRLEELLESDTLLLESLRKSGHGLLAEPRAKTAHVNVSRPWSFVVDTFDAAREYAALRAEPFSLPVRALYAGGSPLIPAVRLRRVLRDVRRVAPGGGRMGRAFLPALLFGLVVSAAGELRGLHGGPGQQPAPEGHRAQPPAPHPAGPGPRGRRLSDPPSCSVVVATRDRPQHLAECLRALTRLEYPRTRYEVVVVDDGGHTRVDELCHAVAPELRVSLRRQPHRGPGAARNAGAEVASGALLAFTDDDCRPERSWLGLLARRFAAEPDRGLGGHTVNALPGNPFASTSQMIIDAGYEQANADPRAARFFTSNNMALPAREFHALGGFDPRFRTSEDRELCARWTDSGLRLTYVPEAVVHHAPPLGLASFVRQHFAYGRGARRFHHENAGRAGRSLRVDPRFYAALHRRPFRGAPVSRAISVSALLVLWHAANAGGFAWEALRSRPPQPATEQSRP